MKDLSLHILDIIENSVRAGAKKIDILIEQNSKEDVLKICINDNGKGMEKKLMKNAADPFFTTKKSKKVGLGIPLLKQAAESSNGKFSIESKKRKGTKIEAEFQNSHIDRKPLGDIAETFISAVLMAPETDFIFRYKKDGSGFVLKTKELKKQIGVKTLTNT
ncbi:MAG: ATP-binding protein, partial [Ignavibacteria bacterium]